ncbi:MAG TPA: PDZ domain-containing protein [Candidatus Polarisedimenticolia bacterium]|nr:PDZ domain-containing protein [Candidatus Polarisedimenticolia bacterium]
MSRLRVIIPSAAALAAWFAFALLPAAGPGTVGAAEDTPPDGFYRYPTVAKGMVVFASEGDLWKVPLAGGTAQRMTAYEGEEKFPALSPDGRFIAFTAQYEGNDDVYVMSASGGEPARLTWHPATDQVIGWTPDGTILFRSRRDTPHGDYRIYTLPREGGIPTLVKLEPAAWLSFEPKGKRVAFQKIGLETHNWKRYKGGEAEQIYVGTLEPLAMKETTDWDGKDAFPMWAGDGRIYFVSDRWGRPNLASMKPDGTDVKRHTTFDDYDVRWPSLGDTTIVFQHKMDLFSYDLASGKAAQIPVTLPSDRIQVRDRFVDPMANLRGWGLSKDGERIVLETRGDLFVTRTKRKGLIRRLTENSAARTRGPAFSPDGTTVAGWTEIDGEEQLILDSADNSAAFRQVGKQEPGWHYAPVWSPDGKRLAWSDQKYRVMIADVAGGATTVVDTGQFETDTYEWSPDSRYLAYEIPIPNGFSQVRIYDSQGKKSYDVSTPMFNSYSPTWDPKGKYLYYLSDRWINPYLDRFEARFIVMKSALPIVVALQADGKLPFAPRSDMDPKDEKKDADKKDADKKSDDKSGDKKDADKKDDDKDKKKEDEKVEPIRIDFDGLADRIVQVPVPPGRYSGLKAVEGKLHWLAFEARGMTPMEGPDDDDDDGPGGTLYTYDLAKEKMMPLAQGVRGYDVSMNGKVLVYRTKDHFIRAEAGSMTTPQLDGPQGGADDPRVDLSGWTVRVNPRQEWKQMLREAWRLQRDFFYDPKMHGVDWEAVWKQYGELADRMASRDDLSDLLGEMFGELSVGHAYHQPGDIRRGRPIGTGLLGADLAYDPSSGFWQIGKIYEADYPDPKTSSPLARPDFKVKPGMWLVAIDGRALQKGEDYLRRLANRAGQEVELSVNDAPKEEGARRIIVKPVANDTRLRYADWIRETRAYVDKKSNGQIGYLHLYDMGGFGLQQFARDYPPQWDKKGFIIDDRWNHGGFVAPMIVAHLDRKLFSVAGLRYSSLRQTTPDRAFHGHLDVLINRQGGSDCETLALAVKDFGLGQVIGTRTWGGWVGIRGDKPFRDGGVTTQPEFGGWDPKGKGWQIEGHGVDPDVVIDLSPDGFLDGVDEQIDYAIKDLMDKIAKDPRDLAPMPPVPPRPLKTNR